MASPSGVGFMAVIGPAGCGKTTEAQRFATINPNAIYLSYQDRFTHIGLFKEVCFCVTGSRPYSSQACHELLQEKFSSHPQILIVDEADRMPPKHLNTLRDIHDQHGVPICLCGEEPLRGKLYQERRLISRVRRVITFKSINAIDVIKFFKASLDQILSAELAAQLTRHCQGNFRRVVKDALDLERMMRVSGKSTITAELMKEVCSEDR